MKTAVPSVKGSSELIFLTSADARRMEAAEEYGALRYAQWMQRHNPKSQAAWEAFGGGHIVFISKDSPVGRAHGLGFNGKVSPEQIQHVEQFYFRHGATARVDVSAYADSTLFEALKNRGFYVEEFNQTLARRIGAEEHFDFVLKGMEIRPVKKGEEQAWAAVLAKVFFADKWKNFVSMFLPWAGFEDALSLAVFHKGKMVGGASGMIVPEYRLGAFFGAATLPEFQGRGIQSALLKMRLRIVQQRGCDLAVTLTMPGTTSQRNAERAGFRVAYTKVVTAKAAR